MNWRTRTRYWVKECNSWKPCICIQGGGARGAWEAGVLAALLDYGRTSHPVSIWGTSAGALNGVWAATLPQGSEGEKLLQYWLILAKRIRLIFWLAVGPAVGLAFGIVLWLLWELAASILLGMFLELESCWNLVLLALLFSIPTFILPAFISVVVIGMMLVRHGYIERLPGLLPIPLGAKLLPYSDALSRCVCYFFTADVQLEAPPPAWNMHDLSAFMIKPEQQSAELLSDGTVFDVRTAMMTSAALPGVFKPLRVKGKLLLDGGLVSNLPVEFVTSQGTLGGNCLICIVPRPFHALDFLDHVDYRVMRFLRDLRDSQRRARASAASGARQLPPHTFQPVIIICPEEELRSGLLCGFFRPSLLRSEFGLGQSCGEKLIQALQKFEAEEDEALDGFLLENHDFQRVRDVAPKPGCWACWANPKWMMKVDDDSAMKTPSIVKAERASQN